MNGGRGRRLLEEVTALIASRNVSLLWNQNTQSRAYKIRQSPVAWAHESSPRRIPLPHYFLFYYFPIIACAFQVVLSFDFTDTLYATFGQENLKGGGVTGGCVAVEL